MDVRVSTNSRKSQLYMSSMRSLNLANSPLLGTVLVPTWEHFSPNVGIICSQRGNLLVVYVAKEVNVLIEFLIIQPNEPNDSLTIEAK